MSALFCVSIHFLQPYCHARDADDAPEWPPSPLRVFQALVNAAAARWNDRQSLVFAGPALRWFEILDPPEIRCATGRTATTAYRLYVPDNVADKVATVWSRGREASIADYRSEKDVLPTHLVEGTAVHYLYKIHQSAHDVAKHLDVIRMATRSLTHLGWGIDMVAADARVIDRAEVVDLPGDLWVTAPTGPVTLRCPRAGSLDQLLLRHDAFLRRVAICDDGEERFDPVPPVRVFRSIAYRRAIDPLARPFAVFRLLDENGDTYRHPHSKLIHLAGMLRHLAIDATTRNPPRGVSDPAAWVKRYVAGHRDKGDAAVDLPHAQLSYVPLPSVGTVHSDPGVRRVMIVAPVGDDGVLEHVARQLDGLRLKPEKPEHLRGPVFLNRVRQDNVARFYTKPATTWASFTPVILPGHDDHKPEKTRKLIEKALLQSGVDQPCEFEWSAFSAFPKSYSAHKYMKDETATGGKRPVGYLRPDHLLDQTAVHLRLTFLHDFPGPLTLGAGRHCGFGVMAAPD